MCVCCSASVRVPRPRHSLALERDWVVVIADEDSQWLTDITAQLKQIDLCCDLVAPSLVSLLAAVSYKAVALIIGSVCTSSPHHRHELMMMVSTFRRP